MSAARIVAAAAALAFVCLSTWRFRTGKPGRGALGLGVAALLTLYAADLTAAIPDGEEAVADAGDTFGAWTYPFMAAMAFLETAIPPVTLIFPGEWVVLFGGAMAGEGELAIVPLILIVWGCSIAGDSVTFGLGRRLGRPFLLHRGRRLGMTHARLDRVDAWIDRYGAAGVCLGRLLPLARPFGPFMVGSSRFPYRRFLAWDVAGTLLFSIVFCGSGYVFYRSYDEVLAVLSRAGFALVGVVTLAVGTVVLLRRRRAVGPPVAEGAE